MKLSAKAVSLLLICILLLQPLTCSAGTATNDEIELVPFELYSDVNAKRCFLTLEVPYDDRLFEEPATSYNHPLAQASLGLAFSNFRGKTKKPGEDCYALQDFLSVIGFTDLQSDQYDVDTTSDTVASMIARKETVIDGTPCTIIAVSICGAGYENEWLSNFAFSDEDRHAGFDRAANTVLGRLLLYLYNHPTDHQLKIWISGYSRAGAIANLLGQKLSNGRLCAVEDLYVYTFATPNTTTAPEDHPCPSIFNIVGSFDPFPTIPPAEWGYARYGTTLYLPAQEVDSNYSDKRENVENIYQDMTGISYWNSPNCNWILQKMLQIVYSNITSAELYSSFLKDIISGIWRTSGILPRIRLLFDMMDTSIETDSSVRSVFSTFKDLFSPYLYNLLTGSNADESTQPDEGVSLLSQIMHEHSPEVYCAWMMSSSDPEELFISSPSYYRISTIPGLKIMEISRLESNGWEPASNISAISFDINTILTVPGDMTYVLTFTAEHDIVDDELVINSYALPSLEANTAFLTLNLKQGETADLILSGEDAPEILTYSNKDVSIVQSYVSMQEEDKAASFEYEPSGWFAKHLIDLFLWGSLLMLCILVFIIIRINIRKKKNVFYVRRAFLTLMAVFFLLDQVFRNLFPWGVLPIIICQGICSVLGAVITLFALREKKDRYTLLLFVAMLCYTVGDVVTRSNSFFGTVSYGVGHLILCIGFLIGKRPDRRHLMLLLAALVPVYTIEIMTIEVPSDLITSMVYSVILLSMVILSSLRSKQALAGGLLFLVADLILTLKTILNAPGWLFFLALGAYYLSIALLSSDAYDESGAIALHRKRDPDIKSSEGDTMNKRKLNTKHGYAAKAKTVLLIVYLIIFIDCLIVGAREAVWLAGAMTVLMIPIKIGKGKVMRYVRKAVNIIGSVLNIYVIGMIVFLLLFASTHIADGSEIGPVFLLGSDMKDNRPGALYLSRIETARTYLEDDPSVEIIACGGLTGDNTVTEAEAARTMLIESGIASERILIEDKSTRTLDNFDFAAKILESTGTRSRQDPAAVITNRFHFYRTTELAKAAGYNTVRLIPANGDLLTELPWLIREVLTVTKYWICGPN